MVSRLHPRSNALALLLLFAVSALIGGAAGAAVSVLISRDAVYYPVVADGLDAPRGLYALPDGGLLIAEGGGRILRLSKDGKLSAVLKHLPTAAGNLEGGGYIVGPSGVALADGVYYYVVGEFRDKGFREAYRYEPGGAPQRLTGQDPTGLAPPNLLTNPYDLAVEPDGSLLVSDAGVNAVLRVDPAGELTRYADIVAEHGPESPQRDAVPTGSTRGPDGALYVGSLSGYPHTAGTASVYRLEDLNADGDAMDPGETTVYADGFTTITDVAFDVDGSLLLTEFSSDLARLIGELGYARSGELPGRLVRWRGDGAEPEIVADGLVSPTSVAVTSSGEIYVSEEFAGRIVRIDKSGPGLPTYVYSLIGALLGAAVFVVALTLFLRSRRRHRGPEGS